MTEFERIKAMNVVEFAAYITDLQKQAITDYEHGFFPKGVFENVTMLECEVEKPSVTSQMAAAEAQSLLQRAEKLPNATDIVQRLRAVEKAAKTPRPADQKRSWEKDLVTALKTLSEEIKDKEAIACSLPSNQKEATHRDR